MRNETLNDALVRHLTHAEWTTLTCGLENVANHYDENAKACMADGHKLVWWGFLNPNTGQEPRWKERSRFFPGIAAAMADQWGGVVEPEAAYA